MSPDRPRSRKEVTAELSRGPDGAHLGEHGAGLGPLAVLVVGDDVGHRVDQGQVAERLGKVSELGSARRLDLLRVEAQSGPIRDQPLAQLARSFWLSDLR